MIAAMGNNQESAGKAGWHWSVLLLTGIDHRSRVATGAQYSFIAASSKPGQLDRSRSLPCKTALASPGPTDPPLKALSIERHNCMGLAAGNSAPTAPLESPGRYLSLARNDGVPEHA